MEDIDDDVRVYGEGTSLSCQSLFDSFVVESPLGDQQAKTAHCPLCHQTLPEGHEDQMKEVASVQPEIVFRSVNTTLKEDAGEEENEEEEDNEEEGMPKTKKKRKALPKKRETRYPRCLDIVDGIAWVHKKRETKLLCVELPRGYTSKDVMVFSTYMKPELLQEDSDATEALNQMIVKEEKSESGCMKFFVPSAKWGDLHDSMKDRLIVYQLRLANAHSLLFFVYLGKLKDDLKDRGWWALSKLPIYELPPKAARYLGGLELKFFWERIIDPNAMLFAVQEPLKKWQHDLLTIQKTNQHLGSYSGDFGWWTRDGKAGVSAHLQRGLPGATFLCALPYFHLKHKRFFWLCLTYCPVIKNELAKAAIGKGRADGVGNAGLVGANNEFEVTVNAMWRYVDNGGLLLEMVKTGDFVTPRTTVSTENRQ